MKRFSIRNRILVAAIVAASVNLIGCDSDPADLFTTSDDANVSDELQKNSELFSGCYTVTMEQPAQIKISQQQDRLVMQMKEPKSAQRVWDDPEPLEFIKLDQVSKYFSIDADNVSSMIGRPDRVFVIAHVKEAYANINPLLDSQYLGFIFRGANTIYKVECDDSPMPQIPANKTSTSVEDSHITIKSAGKIESN